MPENNILPFKNEFFRKIIHLLSSFFPILYLYVEKTHLLLILALANFIIIFIELNKNQMNYVGKTFNKYISFVVRPNESKQLMNATYLCVTYFFVVLFFDKNIAIYSLLLLSISDSFAAIIGIKYGQVNIIHSKTLEGTFAFIISGILLVMVISVTKNYIVDYSTLFFGVLFASIVELLTPSKYDNISVPLSYAIFLTLFLKI